MHRDKKRCHLWFAIDCGDALIGFDQAVSVAL